MKNYLEHRVKVKFMDGFFAKSQDWQWFIDYIELNFDLSDFITWKEFCDRSNPLKNLFSYFVKIAEVTDKEIIFKSDILKELYFVARYFRRKIKREELQVQITSNFAKVLFLAVWITKLVNQDNGTDYLIDMRFLIQKNSWELINCESIIMQSKEIKAFAESIQMEGFYEACNFLEDNINQKLYPVTDEFFDMYSEKIISADAFNFQYIPYRENLPWEEKCLLEMLQISISNRQIDTGIILNGYPDISIWTHENINIMKKYFSNDIANFVLETIAYVMYSEIPSSEVILLHCRLLFDRVKVINNEYDIFCSSYEVISYLFSDKLMKDFSKEAIYLNLLTELSRLNDVYVIRKLQSDNFPISTEQRKKLNDFFKKQYMLIDKVKDVHQLRKYFENSNVTKKIDDEYFKKVCDTFYLFIKNKYDSMIANLFYSYMIFLLELLGNGTNVDKRKVELEILRVQKVWQDDYYSKVCDTLYECSYNIRIPTAAVDEYNMTVLSNPLVISDVCMFPKEDEMCKVMGNVSEHAFIHTCMQIHLNEIYPDRNRNRINYERHDVDVQLKEIVDRIKESKSYKFLNKLDTETYVSAIHDRYKHNAMSYISMFNLTQKLYDIVQENSNCELLPYPDKLLLGHITQLFPVLEMKIRELASMVGVNPFKEITKEFMKYKDPSSILREMLYDVYSEIQSFENMSDLLFVYNFMYNSNSLNIRNECIHGRNYIMESNREFAFKTVLLSIYMIIFRIKNIEMNTDRKDNR